MFVLDFLGAARVHYALDYQSYEILADLWMSYFLGCVFYLLADAYHKVNVTFAPKEIGIKRSHFRKSNHKVGHDVNGAFLVVI